MTFSKGFAAIDRQSQQPNISGAREHIELLIHEEDFLQGTKPLLEYSAVRSSGGLTFVINTRIAEETTTCLIRMPNKRNQRH